MCVCVWHNQSPHFLSAPLPLLPIWVVSGRGRLVSCWLNGVGHGWGYATVGRGGSWCFPKASNKSKKIGCRGPKRTSTKETEFHKKSTTTRHKNTKRGIAGKENKIKDKRKIKEKQGKIRGNRRRAEQKWRTWAFWCSQAPLSFP